MIYQCIYIRDFSKFHEISQIFTKFHKISQIFTKFHGISRNFTKFHKISRNFTKFHKISRNFTKFHETSRNFTKVYKILVNFLRVFRRTLRNFSKLWIPRLFFPFLQAFKKTILEKSNQIIKIKKNSPLIFFTPSPMLPCL